MYEWTNGEVITADKLNNTGNIVMLPSTPDGLDASFNDITSFLQHGVVPALTDSYDGGTDVSYLNAAYPYNGEYYAEFFHLVRGQIEIAITTLKADSPSENMVWA